jgi:ribosomal protein L7/L12
MASVQRQADRVNVSYPVREQFVEITAAEYRLIKVTENNKVAAIKFICAQYKLGLYEAKQVVDTIHAHRDVSS